jgi:hypothetical protein
LTGLELVGKGLLVQYCAPTEIHDAGMAGQQVELASADEAPSLVGERGTQHQEIRARQQSGQMPWPEHPGDVPVWAPGPAYAEDPQPEAGGESSDLASDRAHAHDDHRLAGDRRVEPRIPPRLALSGHEMGHAVVQHQQRGNGVLGALGRVDAARVRQDHARRNMGSECLDARTGCLYPPKARCPCRQVVGGKVRSDDHDLGLAERAVDLGGVRTERDDQTRGQLGRPTRPGVKVRGGDDVDRALRIVLDVKTDLTPGRSRPDCRPFRHGPRSALPRRETRRHSRAGVSS